MRITHISASLLSAAALATAWPQWLPDLNTLVVRQASSSTANTVQTASRTSSSAIAQITSTNLNTASASSGSHSTTTTSSLSINPASPAGAVTMLTPAPALTSAIYKIGGDPITFAWNYTNLLATPTAIDVLVSCSTAAESWTLTSNMSFATNAAVTWDTNGYQQTAAATPLLTAEYTLVIYDSEAGVSATPAAGYLATFSGLKFSMYVPQPYLSIADGWVCAACSAGVGVEERRAVGMVLGMVGVTVLSFTWFVSGLW